MRIELIKILRRPVLSQKVQADKSYSYCFACGDYSDYDYAEIINDDLARQWGITAKQRHAFSARESRQCKKCGATHRNRQMAQAMCHIYKNLSRVKSLKELVENEQFRKLDFAEINACGGLHQFFIRHPKMIYSEYEPSDKSINSEDLHKLTYKDKSFDLVVTSDTLEHIPDHKQALREIYRILKPAGKHIFTIPIIWQNQTRSRAKLIKNSNSPKYLLEPSYHGPDQPDNLVWTDFGGDVLKTLKETGFKTKVLYYNLLNPSDASSVLVSTKVE